jgi:IS30 family transposase
MGNSKVAKRFKHLKIADKAKIVAWSEEWLSSRKIATLIAYRTGQGHHQQDHPKREVPREG